MLKRQGKDLAGPCPFHAEATPSLIVTPDKYLWHCFGLGADGAEPKWSRIVAMSVAREDVRLS